MKDYNRGFHDGLRKAILIAETVGNVKHMFCPDPSSLLKQRYCHEGYREGTDDVAEHIRLELLEREEKI